MKAGLEFDGTEVKGSFERFEKAATKGHEESQWIWDVVKDMGLGDAEKAWQDKALDGLGCNF